MDKNRKTAFDALLEIQTKKAYSNIAVNRAVTKNIPDNCIAGGVPARVIKEIENDLESDQ